MDSAATRRLSELRLVSSADVYKKGVLAGSLSRAGDGGVVFAYGEGYAGVPVATTLPLGRQAVATTGGGLPAFFAGALPEGHRLNVLRGAVKSGRDDELTILLAVGEDLPGDVVVVPAGQEPRKAPPSVSGDPAEQDFAAQMEEPDLRGIAGVQDKLSASMLSTPVRWANGEGILKIDPRVHPHLVVNEFAHLQAARAMRIPVAQSTVVTDRHGRNGLLVSRFDRLRRGRRVERRALEDAAQVMGILPAAKYAVTSEEVALALTGTVPASLVAARNLYLQFVYAWLTGNGDLHAKNLSILEQEGGGFAMAPMYDLPSTWVYRDRDMALSVEGRTTNLRERHWAAFADTLGINQKAAASLRRLALAAASSVDWEALPFEGSVRRGVERELAARRREVGG